MRFRQSWDSGRFKFAFSQFDIPMDVIAFEENYSSEANFLQPGISNVFSTLLNLDLNATKSVTVCLNFSLVSSFCILLMLGF